MEEKTITVTIDELGKAALDLSGFSGASCEKVFEDFRGGDQLKLERKKAAYYTNRRTEQEHTRR
jgi:hypothetical protein